MRVRDEVRAEGDLHELEEHARHAAGLLKAMSNPSRLVILCQLVHGERSVGELERAVGLSQSGISQHLALLRRQSVVTSRRVRQTVLYSLGNAQVATLMATLRELFCPQSSGTPRAAVTARDETGLAALPHEPRM